VNLVSENLASAMNITCMDAPREISELECAGLEAAPSTLVAPPRIKAAPVSLECRSLSAVVTGPQQTIVIGRIVAAHVADEFIINGVRGHIDTPALRLIGRMHGGGWYARTSDLFSIDRPTYAGWLQEQEKARAKTEG